MKVFQIAYEAVPFPIIGGGILFKYFGHTAGVDAFDAIKWWRAHGLADLVYSSEISRISGIKFNAGRNRRRVRYRTLRPTDTVLAPAFAVKPIFSISVTGQTSPTANTVCDESFFPRKTLVETRVHFPGGAISRIRNGTARRGRTRNKLKTGEFSFFERSTRNELFTKHTKWRHTYTLRSELIRRRNLRIRMAA